MRAEDSAEGRAIIREALRRCHRPHIQRVVGEHLRACRRSAFARIAGNLCGRACRDVTRFFSRRCRRSDNRVAVANDAKVRQRAFDLSRRPTFELLGAVGFDSAVVTARTCEDRSFAGLDVTRMYAVLPCCVVNVYKLRFRSGVTFLGAIRRNLFCNEISIWARNMRDGM